MANKPTVAKGYRHQRLREPRTEVKLSRERLYELPRIEKAVEAWIVNTSTLEVELQTAEGQRAILPLGMSP